MVAADAAITNALNVNFFIVRPSFLGVWHQNVSGTGNEGSTRDDPAEGRSDRARLSLKIMAAP
jgi:hypothetical protein